MRPWLDPVTVSSSALEYIGNIIFVAGLILLLVAGTFLLAS